MNHFALYYVIGIPVFIYGLTWAFCQLIDVSRSDFVKIVLISLVPILRELALILIFVSIMSDKINWNEVMFKKSQSADQGIV